MGSQITVRFWGQQGRGSLKGGPHRRVLPPSSHPPSPYLAAADGALLVVVGCPAGAVRPVLPLEEAGVGVLLQLLRVPALGALGELGLPRGQAGPPCLAPVGDVHLGGRRVGTEGDPTGTPRQAAGTVPILSPSQPTPGRATQPRTLPCPQGGGDRDAPGGTYPSPHLPSRVGFGADLQESGALGQVPQEIGVQILHHPLSLRGREGRGEVRAAPSPAAAPGGGSRPRAHLTSVP